MKEYTSKEKRLKLHPIIKMKKNKKNKKEEKRALIDKQKKNLATTQLNTM